MTGAHANARSSWKRFFHIQMPFLSALEPRNPCPYPFRGTCGSAPKRLCLWLSLGSSAPVGFLKFLRSPYVGTNLSRAPQSNPPNEGLTCSAQDSVTAQRLAPEAPRLPSGAKPETRKRANNEEELHMRRRGCEGQVPPALTPLIHQIRDSVSHKSPRPLLRERGKSPCFSW